MVATLAFTPYQFGAIKAFNRFVMAPMSRNRATPDGCATALMAEYYAQRASAGLIVSEGIQPSSVGQGFMNSPGLHSARQIDSWRQVTSAVQAKGGRIVAQIMHAGRIGHPSLYASAHRSLAPSAIPATGTVFTPTGPLPYAVPQAMSLTDVARAIEEHAQAAHNAIEAGFDGIEIHAGNGFLIHQFLSTNVNQRNDKYGGNTDGRIRFAREVIDASVRAIGAERIGVRISPANTYNDLEEDDTAGLYHSLVSSLPAGLAYLHVMESNNRPQTKAIRALWKGPLILNPHSDQYAWPASSGMLDATLNSGLADGVCFGALFLANPDLVERVRTGAGFNPVDEKTFYGGDERGYTDYPTLKELGCQLEANSIGNHGGCLA